jgi:hypothetical protein
MSTGASQTDCSDFIADKHSLFFKFTKGFSHSIDTAAIIW